MTPFPVRRGTAAVMATILRADRIFFRYIRG
jgi:hypothetical protein